MEARAHDLEVASRLLSTGFELLARHQTLNDATVRALELAAAAFRSADATGPSNAAPSPASFVPPSTSAAPSASKKKSSSQKRRDRKGATQSAAAVARELAYLQAKVERLGSKTTDAPTKDVPVVLKPLFSDFSPPPPPPIPPPVSPRAQVVSQPPSTDVATPVQQGKRGSAARTPRPEESPQSQPSASKSAKSGILHLAMSAFSDSQMREVSAHGDLSTAHTTSEISEFVTDFAKSQPSTRKILGDGQHEVFQDIVNVLTLELASKAGMHWFAHLNERFEIVVAEVNSKVWRRAQAGR